MAQPGDPAPLGVRPAGPLVGDLDDQPPVLLAEPDDGRGAGGVLGDVGQALGDDEVGGGLDDRQRPRRERLGLDGHGRRRAPAERLDRRGQPAVGQHRRGDPAREVTQLADRGARLLPRAADELGLLGTVAEPLLGPAEQEAQRDQARRAPSWRSRSIRRSSAACTSSAPRRVRVSSPTRSASCASRSRPGRRSA